VDHAVAHVPRVDAARVVVLGHSAGGHAALFAGAFCRAAPRLVVAAAPVADMVAAHDRRLSDEGDAAQRYCGAAFDEVLYSAACPTRAALPALLARADLLVTTGDSDADVPPDLTRAFAAAARARVLAARRAAALTGAAAPPRRVAFLEVAGADHYAVTDARHAAFRETWATVEALLA